MFQITSANVYLLQTDAYFRWKKITKSIFHAELTVKSSSCVQEIISHTQKLLIINPEFRQTNSYLGRDTTFITFMKRCYSNLIHQSSEILCTLSCWEYPLSRYKLLCAKWCGCRTSNHGNFSNYKYKFANFRKMAIL